MENWREEGLLMLSVFLRENSFLIFAQNFFFLKS